MASSQVLKDSNDPIAGIGIRWNTLTEPEQLVCSLIVLVPLLWLWGWSYLLLIFSIALLVTQYRKGALRLGKPDLFVSSLMVYGGYKLITRILYNSYNDLGLTLRGIINPFDDWICLGIVLWYIKSHDIRVRPKVIFWAFSVLVIEMLILWLVIYVVWHQAPYSPPRSLFGMLTGKDEKFVPGVGNSNFLMPYFADDRSIPGLVRYVFFFHGPESLALVAGFASLMSVDIKNRLWSILLFSASVFILLLSGTRSVWLALPIALILRCLLTAGRVWGPWLLCAVISLSCFVTLALPSVTNVLLHLGSGTAAATGDFRGDSTEVRAEIYRQTIDAILNAPDLALFFGYIETGETVLPGYAPAMVGSHSFILGTSLYQSGLIGTAIFLTYWISLIRWLYDTRAGRPLCCLLIFFVVSLTLSVMAFESTITPITLICAVMRDPDPNSLPEPPGTRRRLRGYRTSPL